MTIAVLGALPQEIDAVRALIENRSTSTEHGRTVVRGQLGGSAVVVVNAGIGKVAAASTATDVIVRDGATRLVLSGVAGALDPRIRVGDIVVADRLSQHDLDASPLFPPMEIPLTGLTRLVPDPTLGAALHRAARRFVESSAVPTQPKPRVWTGEVTSGDQFISDINARSVVRARAPGALCVEMEGAAVAQVCARYGVPLGVVRLISDAADASAADDFSFNLAERAGRFAESVIGETLRALGSEEA